MTALAVARPRAVVVIRLLAAIQVAIGVCVAALSGFGLIYLIVVAYETSVGATHPSRTVPVITLVAVVMLSFALLATLGRLGPLNPAGRHTLTVIEVLLIAVTVVFVFTAHSDSLFVLVPAGVELLCALAALGLLATPAVRRWSANS